MVRPVPSREEWDIDDLVASIEQDAELGKGMAEARQWLAQDMPFDLPGLRMRGGLSQSQLAEKVGLRQPNISAIESGKRKPEYATAKRIAEALGVSVDDFFMAFDKSQGK